MDFLFDSPRRAELRQPCAMQDAVPPICAVEVPTAHKHSGNGKACRASLGATHSGDGNGTTNRNGEWCTPVARRDVVAGRQARDSDTTPFRIQLGRRGHNNNIFRSDFYPFHL